MDQPRTARLSIEELESQQTAELPHRDLLATLSILGLPLLGVSDVAVNVNTAGPGYLISG